MNFQYLALHNIIKLNKWMMVLGVVGVSLSLYLGDVEDAEARGSTSSGSSSTGSSSTGGSSGGRGSSTGSSTSSSTGGSPTRETFRESNLPSGQVLKSISGSGVSSVASSAGGTVVKLGGFDSAVKTVIDKVRNDTVNVDNANISSIGKLDDGRPSELATTEIKLTKISNNTDVASTALSSDVADAKTLHPTTTRFIDNMTKEVTPEKAQLIEEILEGGRVMHNVYQKGPVNVSVLPNNRQQDPIYIKESAARTLRRMDGGLVIN